MEDDDTSNSYGHCGGDLNQGKGNNSIIAYMTMK